MDDAFAQGAHRVRFEWGPTGAALLAERVEYAVVVDVLSFSTTVSVAVDRGVQVYPYRWRDETAATFAADHDAVLAVGRSAARGASGVSLSPASVAAAVGLERLVLPSPNGATIAQALGSRGATVVVGALRNARTVAGWLAQRFAGAPSAGVVAIAAGERWPDGSLRPAVEDLWGAGAVIAALHERGVTDLSPEAAAAAAAYSAVSDMEAALLACTSGRELAAAGFSEDVAIAAAEGASGSVPVLVDGRFHDARH